ncbi:MULTISPECIES: type II toxin-antitoxin system RelE/ParE family toxin [unclassified Oceanobacter]|jgi:mRNA interferase RelE/StbE|uniref:type II toxin-antitoxin system RelE family toxin n=1 Tax=unclassified Oceanobacter TaxID=2620260 RepID=UPI002733A633|nr:MULTISPECIES: type II toxin-antitoxin system RelE/ParE family toxin [unclassified Oceanobacter]MDP2504946.1 type II toxin-antitoxin system RelE/ParE family toxin [Oceanobacter sp. 3_MG-2023]MDP2610635.1 type II toxin-antitoxin system RelE/ParE family toxin [Oceanobacter sp. 1_MG-2023]MDP2613890.1 type II toxin-antitoxin system RelE/ParE family toxin [Oceanobacter sp. 2_MG-2023]
MEKYRITFKKSVAKDLRVIPKNDIKKILSKIDTLAVDPRGEGCIKLSGQENYRVRQGLYRIVYEIKDDVLVVNVVKVAHRSHVYKSN